mgnify:CR=1 FL=1
MRAAGMGSAERADCQKSAPRRPSQGAFLAQVAHFPTDSCHKKPFIETFPYIQILKYTHAVLQLTVGCVKAAGAAERVGRECARPKEGKLACESITRICGKSRHTLPAQCTYELYVLLSAQFRAHWLPETSRIGAIAVASVCAAADAHRRGPCKPLRSISRLRMQPGAVIA